jgi:protein SCO1/2
MATVCFLGLFLSGPGGAKTDRLAVISQAPDFSLVTQDEKQLRLADLRGNVVLVGFIFTTCNGTCPATTHRMSQVQHLLRLRGQDASVRLLSITLDPSRDTPEALRRYQRLYDVDSKQWSFLTGPTADVAKTIAAWGMWTRAAANGQLDHPSRVFLVDAHGRIREIYNLDFMKPDWVAEDIALLLAEKKR